MKFTHRVRRCNGNRAAWLLVALRDDGSEIESYGGSVTSMSLDGLFRHSGGLLPGPGDAIEFLYYPQEPQT